MIDVINPVTDRSWIEGETLDEIRLRYPNAERVNIEQWCAEKGARQDSPVTWDEITREQYWYWLECLPPAYHGAGAFLVGEASDHHSVSGAPRYQACIERGDKFLASSRPMTRAEFRAYLSQ